MGKPNCSPRSCTTKGVSSSVAKVRIVQALVAKTAMRNDGL